MPARVEPVAEIRFAAKVGFLTKDLWREFFANGGIRWQNKRWKYFLDSEIFVNHECQRHILLPNPKHSLVRAETGRLIARPPLIGQIDHDQVVARSCLLLETAIPGAIIKTEGELRRMSPPIRGEEFCPMHPDLTVELGSKKVAVEIELNQKSRARYLAILRKYRSADFDYIVYVIRSRVPRNSISAALIELKFPTDEITLGFCSLDEWKAAPENAKIYSGDKVFELINLNW